MLFFDIIQIQRLEMSGNLRDLALFNTAIDSKLRGSDLVRLQVRDVLAAGQFGKLPFAAAS